MRDEMSQTPSSIPSFIVQVIPELKLWQYFVVDVEVAIGAFQEALKNGKDVPSKLKAAAKQVYSVFRLMSYVHVAGGHSKRF